MKSLTMSEVEDVVPAIRDEIRRSDEARYDHRLHALLLVAQGMSCNKAARLPGDALRTVAYWVGFEEEGLPGLWMATIPGDPISRNTTPPDTQREVPFPRTSPGDFSSSVERPPAKFPVVGIVPTSRPYFLE